MSGGVDSSAAVWLLQREGWDCAGVTMRLSKEKQHMSNEIISIVVCALRPFFSRSVSTGLRKTLSRTAGNMKYRETLI